MTCYQRGLRGAISVEANTKEAIHEATRKLLTEMMATNEVRTEDIASVLFTATSDLNADFPAYVAREMGWQYVPLLCAKEMDVPGAMERCIRILMHVNTTKKQEEMSHVYLGEARKLRPDLVERENE
ncbi:chorismate mutase [Heliorestis acidaminivorans]|uniref:chorismate mutase n=1 Tax=Heliorestis acidaminivorans TaxID=553427 RepID=A0A6I0EZ06_9FIRM|nr:chorismate mutase [Heliorestis acidaminivorans]KAB2952632.1 chorismate mutase [Heliorestis acidaminivorans]